MTAMESRDVGRILIAGQYRIGIMKKVHIDHKVMARDRQLMENPFRDRFLRNVSNRKDSNDLTCFRTCQEIDLELDKAAVFFLGKTDKAAHRLFRFILGICVQHGFIHKYFQKCLLIFPVCNQPRETLKKCVPAPPKPFHKCGICGVPHFHHPVPGNAAVPENQFIGPVLMIMLQKLLLVPAPQLFLLLDRLGNIGIHNIYPADLIRGRQHGQRTARPEIAPVLSLHTPRQLTGSCSALQKFLKLLPILFSVLRMHPRKDIRIIQVSGLLHGPLCHRSKAR